MKRKPKALRVAEVQALKELGYTYRQIGTTLKMSQATVCKYLHLEDEIVSQYKSVIKNKQMIEDYETAEKARNLFTKKLDVEDVKFRDLVGLWKISRELQMPRVTVGQSTNVQINITENEKSVEVIEVS